MNSIDVVAPVVRQAAALQSSVASGLTIRHAVFVVQMALAAAVVYLYSIEGRPFFSVFLLAAVGFVLNLALPLRYRMPFFVGLSLTGAAVVFGIADAAWLVGCGLGLIGIVHLPFSMKVRGLLLISAAALLAVARAGFLEAPWSATVWPILASMFMFRLILYMLALKNSQVDRGLWPALAYFFMLPNLVFPLFPVIDYQTFRRTHYDKGDITIYEQGFVWIARGLVHLLLYRLVYQTVLTDPVDVTTLGDLVQFMLGTFLLYLRVSGQFHIIVGILHLFGFRLPETHKLYYLAHSFTELWRRINIYWTDFMMKAVFYPTYFRVKKSGKIGPQTTLVVSTAAVFLVTWFLHSYQWFWLRAGFPVTIQDTLFWGILGGLVIVGAVRESNAVRTHRPRSSAWNWQAGLKAATTFTCFCFLWSLWSAESMTQWVWMLGSAANVDAKGVALSALAVTTIVVLGGRDWSNLPAAGPRWLGEALSPTVRTTAILLLLLAIGQPAVRDGAPSSIAAGLNALHQTGLNERDAALQHRGYYEQLDIRAQLATSEVAGKIGIARENWVDLSQTGVLRERRDILTRDLLPSQSVTWNGHIFSTNRWGMRDGDYTLMKPPATLRIALLGPSHVMGNGVGDGETFESLVEARLNRELDGTGFSRIEILNFGVDGYSLLQQVAMLEERVLQFKPDVVIATHYHRNRSMTERYLLKLVDRNIDVQQQPLRSLFGKAGLHEIDRGNIPVPFPSLRRVAKSVGVAAGMPGAEAASRVRRIVDDALVAAIQSFADVTRANGAMPIMLGLNAVLDDHPATVPYRAAIDAAEIPFINLLNIFPAAERPSLRVAPWDDHPNDAGHQLIADRLHAELSALLRSRVSHGDAAAAVVPPHRRLIR